MINFAVDNHWPHLSLNYRFFCSCGSNVVQNQNSEFGKYPKNRRVTLKRTCASGSDDWGSTPHGDTEMIRKLLTINACEFLHPYL